MNIQFEVPSASLFYKNPRPNDPRWGECVKSLGASDAAAGFCLVGYPDDEGVRRNHGRTGCAEAPDRIRSYFYKFTTGLQKAPNLYDVGNLKPTGTLEERRLQLRTFLDSLYKSKQRVLSLGGGHDWAYPDIAAFLQHHSQNKKRCVVINIDAHLDVRSDEKGATSGTSFYRLLEDYKNFDLIQIGIQPYATSKFHVDYAKAKKVRIIYFQDSIGQLRKIFSNLARLKRPIFLSIDVDGFSAAYAPGCSAPSPVGLNADEFLIELPQLMKGGFLRGMGIYEVNPSFDRDDQTSRLAAAIMQKVLMCAPPAKAGGK